MELSILIVNYNSGDLLAHCLRSLEPFVKDIEYEVCVVDNASTDNSLEKIKGWKGNLKLIREGRNLGFSKAMNTALRETTGKYCLWLNPDSELKEGRLRALMEAFDADPKLAVIGPRIENPDGSVQLSCRSFPGYMTSIFGRYSPITYLWPQNPFSRKYLFSDWEHNAVREFDWVSGACLMHPRLILRLIGYLDERFFMYNEDVDFCRRAKISGFKVVYHPGLLVMHHIAGSSRKAHLKMIKVRHESMWAYYLKHFQPNPVKNIVVGLIIMARCGLIMLIESLKSRKPL